MQKNKYWIGVCGLIALIVSACYYRPLPLTGDTEAQREQDSLSCLEARAYAQNSNFEVLADTLWLHQLPFRDSIAVIQGDELVVAELAVHPDDAVDSVWVKVARDQETIGWIRERNLLHNIVPVDPISQCIHWFSRSHTLPFFLVLAVFFLWLAHRTYSRKPVKFLGLNDIDSVFPVTLSWLMAASATLYNSLQHFVPQTWERYYYAPTLNPFDVPFILSLFIVSVGLIVVFGIAMLDDLFHQTTLEVAAFYLLGLASFCILLYVFFTYVWVYLAYVCLVGYTLWCICHLRLSHGYPYACGACGAKMRNKGICPHCGALNE